MSPITSACRAGREHADSAGYRDAPLSGEWAGESIPELSATYGIDLWDEDNQDEFEVGFFERLEQIQEWQSAIRGLAHSAVDIWGATK
jgi:hypothetical protein